MKEDQLRLKIMRALRKEGAYVFHPHGGMYSSGVPDLVGCKPRIVGSRKVGQFFGVEVKTPQNRKGATEQQEKHLEMIREAGGRAGVARSVKEALDIVFAREET
jgi:hypothetical protein